MLPKVMRLLTDRAAAEAARDRQASNTAPAPAVRPRRGPAAPRIIGAALGATG